MLVSIFTLEYFAEKLELIHKYFVLVPEFFAVIITLIIIGRSITLRRWEQPTHYIWLLVAIILVCMIGIVAEAVAPGPLVMGIRNYFKFFPLLLLPAVVVGAHQAEAVLQLVRAELDQRHEIADDLPPATGPFEVVDQ